MEYSMDLTAYAEQWQHDDTYGCYRLERIVYCRKPLAPALQCINLYVPEEFMNDDGTVNWSGCRGQYTARTAPIVLENGIGGYSECAPRPLEDSRCFGLELLKAGMVVVLAGARGKQTIAADGHFCGKSPAGLVDLKCAVRFIKHNRGVFAGNVDRIVSAGISAGGAMSSLLGCTGNSKNYLPYLEEAGAVMDETDDVFAAQCYCPIIDLDHANMGYEWMFHGVYTSDGMPGDPGGAFSEFQKALSDILGDYYIDYFNSLHLKDLKTGTDLYFGKDGRSGTAYQYLIRVLENAATKHLKKLSSGELAVPYTLEQYMNGTYQFTEKRRAPVAGQPPILVRRDGIDKRAWLSWDGAQAKITGLDDMWNGYLSRLKSCTAFDTLANSQSENQVFGDEQQNFTHFDVYIEPALQQLRERFPIEYANYAALFSGLDRNMALQRRKNLINPFYFLGTAERADLAPFYRIRVGTRDADTSFTMAMILSLKTAEAGAETDYAMVWDEGHGPADYPGEFCAWVQGITA